MSSAPQTSSGTTGHSVKVIPYETYAEAADYVNAHNRHSAGGYDVGLVCGSGLGVIAEQLEDKDVIPFTDIPHFCRTTALSHKGNLVIGKLCGKTVVCMQGRLHCYEGYSIQQVTLPIRVMHILGVKQLIVTSACGGLKVGQKMGDFMVVKDHVYLPGLVGMNPLVGPNEDRFGVRFPHLYDVYDKPLQKLAHDVAGEKGLADRVHSGVFCMIFGPMFTSDAEVTRIQEMWKADVIGMSMCPEVTVAAHQSMKVLGIAVITDCVAEYAVTGPPTAELVFAEVAKAADRLVNFVKDIIERM